MLVFLATFAVDIVLLVKVLTADNPSAGLIGAVVVLTALLLLVPRIPDLAGFSVAGMSAQLRGVKQELADTQKAVEKTQTAVAQTNEGVKQELADTQKAVEKTQTAVAQTNERLDNLFALSISEWQYTNLNKLAKGSF